MAEGACDVSGLGDRFCRLVLVLSGDAGMRAEKLPFLQVTLLLASSSARRSPHLAVENHPGLSSIRRS
jgi:hypothetical protein